MSLGLLLLRLIVGGIFAAHGYPKLLGGPRRELPPAAERYLGTPFVEATRRGPAGFAELLRGLGIPLAELAALFVGVVELGGGLLLALGWLTRLAAALLAADMAVAIWKVHWRSGLLSPAGYEFPLSLLGACAALGLGGPGRLSVDGLVAALRSLGRRNRGHAADCPRPARRQGWRSDSSRRVCVTSPLNPHPVHPAHPVHPVRLSCREA